MVRKTKHTTPKAPAQGGLSRRDFFAAGAAAGVGAAAIGAPQAAAARGRDEMTWDYEADIVIAGGRHATAAGCHRTGSHPDRAETLKPFPGRGCCGDAGVEHALVADLGPGGIVVLTGALGSSYLGTRVPCVVSGVTPP